MNEKDPVVMEYAYYIAAVAALIMGFLLYRRRKARKARDHFNLGRRIPSGGYPLTDRPQFVKRWELRGRSDG